MSTKKMKTLKINMTIKIESTPKIDTAPKMKITPKIKKTLIILITLGRGEVYNWAKVEYVMIYAMSTAPLCKGIL